MANKLAHWMNKDILVAIPSVFGDDRPRSCKLLEIDLYGLWLESGEIPDRMDLGEEKMPRGSNISLFVPFAQIAYVLDITSPAKAAMRAAMTEAMSSATQSPLHERPDTGTKGTRRAAKPKSQGRKPKGGE